MQRYLTVHENGGSPTARGRDKQMSVRKWTLLAGIGLLLVVSAAGIHLFAPRNVPPGQPSLVDLRSGNLHELRDEFNRFADRTRVIAMLSPT